MASARELQMDPEAPGLPSEESGVSSGSGSRPASARSPGKAAGPCCRCCPQTRRGKLACGACCTASLILLVVLGVLFGQVHDPTWELQNVSLHSVHVKGLIEGVTAADSSACPTSDPCGVGVAKGCSVCPNPKDHNQGCLCGSPPGTVVASNHSACPALDPCGVVSARGCSSCPGPQWKNDGCTCRIPLSASQFFGGVKSFWDMITGRNPKPISFVVRADVVVRNTNRIGANTLPGHLDVSFQGQPLGTAAVPALTVPGSSEQTIAVHVDIDQVGMDLGMQILQEILQNDGLLKVQTSGSVTAKVAFLKVKAKVACEVTSDVMDSAKLTHSRCDYKYI